MFNRALKELQKFDWEKIIMKSNSLDDFNDAQWRFLKGFIIEKCVEKYSNYNLKYVALKHKDYVWQKFNLSVELKSLTSNKMCSKNGSLRKNFSILLNNSMGTNQKSTLDMSEISDIIIAVFSDGVFAIDKETAMKYLTKKGDGFSLLIPKEEVSIVYKNIYSTRQDDSMKYLKREIVKLIESTI